MKRRHWMAIGSGIMAGALAWAATSAGQTAGDDKDTKPAPARPFKPIMTVEQLMEGQDKLYAEIKDGITDKAWAEAETSAWMLAELANVNHYQSDKLDYRKHADAMAAECQALAKVLRKRDAAAAQAQAAKISENCKACHEQFKKKR